MFTLKVYLKKDIEDFGEIPSTIKRTTFDKFISETIPLQSSFYYIYEEKITDAENAFRRLNVVMVAGLSIDDKDTSSTVVVYPAHMIGKVEVVQSIVETVF